MGFNSMPVVRVRALNRGYYGEANSARDKNGKLIPNHPTGVDGGTEIIRNEGEVFDMDVRAMKPEGAPGTGMDQKVKMGNKTYMLPKWVEVAEGHVDPEDLVAKGHTTSHGIVSPTA